MIIMLAFTYPDNGPVGGGRHDSGEVGASRVGRPEDGVRWWSSVDNTTQTDTGLTDSRRR